MWFRWCMATPPDVIPFTVSTVPLRPISHMAGFLGSGVPVFEIRNAGGITDMLIRTPALGKALAQTLGDQPAALMRGHGAVVVGPNLHMTVGRAYYLNFNARAQIAGRATRWKNNVPGSGRGKQGGDSERLRTCLVAVDADSSGEGGFPRLPLMRFDLGLLRL